MRVRTIRQRCCLALVVAAAIVPTAVGALPIEQIPNPRKIAGNWVSDVANVLQPETEQKLNTLINQLQAANGSEMAVVTLPDSQPFATPKELATKLFNSWGIGQKGKDNGLLFLISVGDRRVEIETGYGIEATLPDTKIGQVIEQQITPAFKTGNFDAGTLSGTETIVQLLQGKEMTNSSNSWNFQPIEIWPVLGISSFTLVLFICYWLQYTHPNIFNDLNVGLQALAVLVVVRGLGQSVKLLPSQSSRVKAWHQRVETVGAMRCASCGGVLEPVDDEAVAAVLKPSEKAAAELGSLQFRGWRCRGCAPEGMHLRGYESTSKRFEHCPTCQELTVVRDEPYLISNPSPKGRDLRITNRHCVHCDYTNQVRELVEPWVGIGDSSSGGWRESSSSGGSDFGGGSSGGGGAGGDW